MEESKGDMLMRKEPRTKYFNDVDEDMLSSSLQQKLDYDDIPIFTFYLICA